MEKDLCYFSQLNSALFVQADNFTFHNLYQLIYYRSTTDAVQLNCVIKDTQNLSLSQVKYTVCFRFLTLPILIIAAIVLLFMKHTKHIYMYIKFTDPACIIK